MRETLTVLVPAIDDFLDSIVAIADQLEEDAEEGDPLPDGVPFVEVLRAGGISTFQRLRRRLQELESFPNIGPG